MLKFGSFISQNRRSLTIFAAILIFSGLSFFTYSVSSQSRTDNKSQSEKSGNTNSLIASEVLPFPKPTPDETPHWLAGSYYDVRDELTATLMLNNKGIVPLEVSPTLYSADGQKLELPPLTVEPTSARFINLSEWAGIGGESFRQGNIRLFYKGKELVLGAQIYLVNEKSGLSFEEKLLELGKFDSRRLEGLWTMPSRAATVKIALTNTTDEPIIVNARLTRRPNIVGSPQIVTLAPHQTRLLDLRQDFADGQQAVNSQAVSLSLDHNGTNWALLARAFVAEPDRGYSNLAQFANPLTGKTKEYHGAGLQTRTDTEERLKPVIAVKNTADANAVVNGRIIYTRVDGSAGSVTIPTTQLRPNEIKLINLREFERRNNLENIKFAGLEISYNTPEGSLAVAVHSESGNQRQVFRVPMWDPLRQKTATGGYPWRIEETSATKSYIKNITDRPQKYVSFLMWANGGMYMIGLKELAPHQTVEIDVKDLRDRQIEDENGRTIPLDVSTGQFQWSLRPEEGEIADTDPLSILSLLGRSEQIDYTKEISSNYACENCCVNNPTGSRINPSSAEIEVGETTSLRAQIAEETCTGVPIEFYEDVPNATWSTNDSSTASVSGGTVTGESAGTATIRANFSRTFRVAEPCPPGGPYLAGCVDGVSLKSEASGKESETSLLEPPCGSCRYGGTYNASPTATITVKPKVTISEAQTKIDGEQASFSVTVQGGTPSNIQWSFEAPSGAGNNPQVNFATPTAANTTAKAHWFALPSSSCPTTTGGGDGPNLSSRYKIKVAVSFAGRSPINKETSLTVNLPDPGGITSAAVNFDGQPELRQNGKTQTWYVASIGTLRKIYTQQPATIINIPNTSQFYNKIVDHEQVHLNDWLQPDGLYYNLFNPNDFYVRIRNFTAPTETNLVSQIQAEFGQYRNDQLVVKRTACNQSEIDAYAVSDSLPPQFYPYQRCGRTTFTNCN